MPIIHRGYHIFDRASIRGVKGDLAIQQVSVTLTHAQIIEFVQTQYYELVPAPGRNKVLVPQLACMNFHIVGGYTNVGVEGYLAIDVGDVDVLTYTNGATIQTIFQGGDSILMFRTGDEVLTGDLTTTLYNRPLSIFSVNFGTGREQDEQDNYLPWSGGDTANKLIVTALFSVMEI
jgi:hypothetical protein